MPIIEGVLREWAEEQMAAEQKATLLRLVSAIIDGNVEIISDTPYDSAHTGRWGEITLVYRRDD